MVWIECRISFQYDNVRIEVSELSVYGFEIERKKVTRIEKRNPKSADTLMVVEERRVQHSPRRDSL